LLIDSGYSHTTVTPLINGRPIQQAVRRLDIGGKFLTNYLKEQLSIRAFYAMDETYVVNELKESVCFVSQNFSRDLEATWKGGKRDRREVDTSVVVDYVLPDYEVIHHGIIRPHEPAAAKNTNALIGQPSREKVVTLGNERFIVPELLFNPGDVGMKEAGLPAVIMESVESLPEGLRPAMLANIALVGGNANIPGLHERLYVDT
jgi:actin-related protein 6